MNRLDEIRERLAVTENWLSNYKGTVDKVELLIQMDGAHKALIDKCSSITYLLTRIERLEKALRTIQTKVDEQAEDEGLWSVPWEGLQPIAEAYLQQELRALHATIEVARKALE